MASGGLRPVRLPPPHPPMRNHRRAQTTLRVDWGAITAQRVGEGATPVINLLPGTSYAPGARITSFLGLAFGSRGGSVIL